MNKKQKKIFFCVCMIFFLFLIVTIYLLKQKSPYEYLKEQKGMTAQTTANECLEEIVRSQEASPELKQSASELLRNLQYTRLD